MKRMVLPIPCIASLIIACVELPPPRDIHRDSLTVVQLRTLRSSDAAYSHPTKISADQMARVLAGVRVQKRQDPIFSIVTGKPEEMTAFSPGEVQALAIRLTEGLAAASPHEVVTFYRRYSDANVSLAVTSGGLFVRDQQLYFILANYRNSPADAMGHRQAMVYEIDPVDDPLLSLRPRSFTVGFSPAQAVIKDSRRQSVSYADPGNVVVIELAHLPTNSGPVPTGP
jgi:hypothetical protein